MATLAETISSALRAVGPTTESRLRDVMADFDAMNLSGEERLSAVTTTIASLAATHHRKHRGAYLDAVNAWSLEIAAQLRPEPLRLRGAAETAQIAEAADLLTSGVESLIDAMNGDSVRTQDRLVTELAVVTRLLGENDANTIHQALLSVGRALDRKDFQPGEVVMVPLRDSLRPLSRDSQLELLAPRGCA